MRTIGVGFPCNSISSAAPPAGSGAPAGWPPGRRRPRPARGDARPAWLRDNPFLVKAGRTETRRLGLLLRLGVAVLVLSGLLLGGLWLDRTYPRQMTGVLGFLFGMTFPAALFVVLSFVHAALITSARTALTVSLADEARRGTLAGPAADAAAAGGDAAGDGRSARPGRRCWSPWPGCRSTSCWARSGRSRPATSSSCTCCSRLLSYAPPALCPSGPGGRGDDAGHGPGQVRPVPRAPPGPPERLGRRRAYSVSFSLSHPGPGAGPAARRLAGASAGGPAPPFELRLLVLPVLRLAVLRRADPERPAGFFHVSLSPLLLRSASARLPVGRLRPALGGGPVGGGHRRNGPAAAGLAGADAVAVDGAGGGPVRPGRGLARVGGKRGHGDSGRRAVRRARAGTRRACSCCWAGCPCRTSAAARLAETSARPGTDVLRPPLLVLRRAFKRSRPAPGRGGRDVPAGLRAGRPVPVRAPGLPVAGKIALAGAASVVWAVGVRRFLPAESRLSSARPAVRPARRRPGRARPRRGPGWPPSAPRRPGCACSPTRPGMLARFPLWHIAAPPSFAVCLAGPALVGAGCGLLADRNPPRAPIPGEPERRRTNAPRQSFPKPSPAPPELGARGRSPPRHAARTAALMAWITARTDNPLFTHEMRTRTRSGRWVTGCRSPRWPCSAAAMFGLAYPDIVAALAAMSPFHFFAGPAVRAVRAASSGRSRSGRTSPPCCWPASATPWASGGRWSGRG